MSLYKLDIAVFSTITSAFLLCLDAAHYSGYAQFIYFGIKTAALEDFNLAEGVETFARDLKNLVTASADEYRLTSLGCEQAHLCYANFSNGIAETPYAVVADDAENSVVITVRGTNSLEDWVIDLQYVPLPLDEVGKLLGFDGMGHHCHKGMFKLFLQSAYVRHLLTTFCSASQGVLTRAKWMYNDLKKHQVLKQLYANDSPYKNYNLVVVGHSLGEN